MLYLFIFRKVKIKKKSYKLKILKSVLTTVFIDKRWFFWAWVFLDLNLTTLHQVLFIEHIFNPSYKICSESKVIDKIFYKASIGSMYLRLQELENKTLRL